MRNLFMAEIIIETWNLMNSDSIQETGYILAEMTPRTSRLPMKKLRRLLLKGEK